jgi:hypothetical protein
MNKAEINLRANHLRCIALWAAIAASTVSNRKYTKPALFLYATLKQVRKGKPFCNKIFPTKKKKKNPWIWDMDIMMTNIIMLGNAELCFLY